MADVISFSFSRESGPSLGKSFIIRHPRPYLSFFRVKKNRSPLPKGVNLIYNYIFIIRYLEGLPLLQQALWESPPFMYMCVFCDLAFDMEDKTGPREGGR